jgi:hypothetical protein
VINISFTGRDPKRIERRTPLEHPVNNPLKETPKNMKRTHTPKMIAAVASFALLAAACGSGSNDNSAPVDEAPAVTEAVEEAAAPEENGPFGSACSAVPTKGEGSFAGMTVDPAATAASNNPLLSTVVTAVGEASLVDTELRWPVHRLRSG